jgi:glutamine synthetase
VGQRHRAAGEARVSSGDLLALVCCDLGAIVRGRSLFASELDAHLQSGIGWVPANHALTPLGPIAEPNPYGSTGDLRLLPDPHTRVRVEAATGPDVEHNALELLLCDIVQIDGAPWECCPRHFLRTALETLESELGLHLVASFEHEFQLLRDSPAELPFSLRAQRAAEPFATAAMRALTEAGAQPERFFAEFAEHQYEIPVAAAPGIAGADRAVVVREVVREVARRHALRASFVPLLDPASAGNGVHVHLNLLDGSGRPVLYDAERSACLSELGGSFAAGVLRHAPALSALTAPSPVSAARLVPHRWSAGCVCLADRNREALLRIPPLVSLGGGEEAAQLHLEYRGADAAANPHLALGAILRAGIEGMRQGLATPPILDRDPARLDPVEAERFGVGALPRSLEGSLHALERDDTARGWMGPLLYDGYVSVKRAELAAVADLDLAERCTRYALAY